MPHANAEDRQRYHGSRYQQAVKDGLCVGCRKVTPPAGQRRCATCAESHTKQAGARQERLKREGKCRRCLKPATPGRTACATCAEQQALALREQRDRDRSRVFEAYGGARCVCCGETRRVFLTIDHVNDDGAEHRKTVDQGHIVRWLIKNAFPVGFRVLCFNCNIGRAINGGVCPHEQEAAIVAVA